MPTMWGMTSAFFSIIINLPGKLVKFSFFIPVDFLLTISEIMGVLSQKQQKMVNSQIYSFCLVFFFFHIFIVFWGGVTLWHLQKVLTIYQIYHT
jgi:hypothetical protein